MQPAEDNEAGPGVKTRVDHHHLVSYNLMKVHHLKTLRPPLQPTDHHHEDAKNVCEELFLAGFAHLAQHNDGG